MSQLKRGRTEDPNQQGHVYHRYTVLLSRESSTAGGRRFGENSSLLHASRTLPAAQWFGSHSKVLATDPLAVERTKGRLP